MPVSPICQVSDAGGPYNPTDDGINVNPGDTVSIQLTTPGPVSQWFLQVYGTDELTPQGSITLEGVDPTTNQVVTPSTTVTFSYPESGGSAIILMSTVTGVGGPVSTTFGIYTPTFRGFRVGASGQTREGDSTFGWASTVNPAIRNLGLVIENNGLSLPSNPYLAANFIGVGVSVTDIGGVAVISTGMEVSHNGSLLNVLPYNAVNFTGAGVSISDVGGVATVTIPGGSNGVSYQNNGAPLPHNPYQTTNFIGATVADVGGVATVTVPSGVNFQFNGSSSGLTNPYLTVNFEGAGVSWDSSGPVGVLTVNIPGGGGSAGLNFESNGSSAGLSNPYLTANFTGHGISVTNGSSRTAIINVLGSVKVFNVLDYGAKGDGATDDSGAIQAAINDAGYGGIIYFPRLPQNKTTFQNYLIENTITLDFYANQNGITFMGESSAWASDSFFQTSIVGVFPVYSGTAAIMASQTLVPYGYIVTLTNVVGLTSNTKVGDMLVLSNTAFVDSLGNSSNNGYYTITSVSPALQTLTFFGINPQVGFASIYPTSPDYGVGGTSGSGTIHWTILKNMFQNTAEFTAFKNLTLQGNGTVGNVIYSTATAGGGGNTSMIMEYCDVYHGMIGVNTGDIPPDYGVPLPGNTFTMVSGTTISYSGPPLVGTFGAGAILVFSTQPTVTYTVNTVTGSQITLTTSYTGATGSATALWGGLGYYQVANCENYRYVKTAFDFNTWAGVKINGSQQKAHNFTQCVFQDQVYGVWLFQGSVVMWDCGYELNTGSNLLFVNPVDTIYICGVQSELSARFLVTGNGAVQAGDGTAYTLTAQNIRFDTTPQQMSPDGRIVQWTYNGGLLLTDCEFCVGEGGFGGQLSGTFSVTNGSPNVTATTSQTGVVFVGSLITFGTNPKQYQVQSITGGTAIVLSSNFTDPTNGTSIAQSTYLSVCLTGEANPASLNAAKPSASIVNCYFGNTPQNANLPPVVVTTSAGLASIRPIVWFGSGIFCNDGKGSDYSTPDGIQYVGTAINGSFFGLSGTFTPTTGSRTVLTSVNQVSIGIVQPNTMIKLTGPAAGYFEVTAVTSTSITIAIPYPSTYPGSGQASTASAFFAGFNVPAYNLLNVAYPVMNFAIPNSAVTDLSNNGFTNVELTGGGASAVIHGMEFNGYNDQVRTITNLTGTTLPFVMESSTEQIPINRFHDPANSGTVTLNVTRSITVRYSGSLSRWVVQSYQ